ncbi:MAG: thiolase family protein [Dehalococcoidia bacterium]|nr:thiolase family protein [Dehalococcoidia bacterium]
MSSHDVVIAGVGIHPFGRFDGKTAVDFGRDAVTQALKDAGIAYKDVQAAYCACMYASATTGSRVLYNLGMTSIPIADVEAACASGGVAIRQAYMAVASGMYDCVLAFGTEKMPKGFMDPSQIFDKWQIDMGLTQNPAYWAMLARRHMEDHGTTPIQLAKVSVKNHKNAMNNPNAMFHTPFTIEEVLNAKMVCDPFTVYMLAAPNEGAAAAVVCSRKFAKEHGVRKPVTILSSVHRTTMHPWFRGPAYSWSTRTDNPPLTGIAAKEAYERAGVGPTDLDVLEVQDTDCFSEIMFTEQLGLCPIGEGGRLVDEGVTEMTGRTPVNTTGGILSCGEPVGASHLRQVHELVLQLRGDAGPRQVKSAKVALGHVFGAGGNCAITILKR